MLYENIEMSKTGNRKLNIERFSEQEELILRKRRVAASEGENGKKWQSLFYQSRMLRHSNVPDTLYIR